MFKKILIANRGEIALRIMRTCREMSIKSIAVYSEIDRKSPFVYFADEAWALGGKTSVESYLDQNKILDIAKKSKADAIHPGYGFLSENPDFAQAVLDSGITFIGPSAAAMRLMGNKTAARKCMIENGVPVVPGTESAISDIAAAETVAQKIGYPVLIKAAAGGGGKGMRKVDEAEQFAESFQSAVREAGSAFGDDSVYLEKYLEDPRHIEFQIFADQKGHTIHLGERECSIQRRHQKIIEESPSAVLTPDIRKKMGAAAINAAKACGYVNAGTIEFLLDKKHNFYFLEMNTRLQVEHPVTEMITGLDLVEEQIRIADGQDLSVKENFESFWGHAIECRLYAEDSEESFAPSPGTIEFLNPADGPGIREDSGVVQGNEISLYYDPMISKLVSWGDTRIKAIDRMKRALKEYEIVGIKTSIPFLIRVLEHKEFIRGNINTHFIDQYASDLFRANPEMAEPAAMAAVIRQIHTQQTIKFNPVHSSKNVSNWKNLNRNRNLR